jgi:hypothetical protein
MFLRFQPKNTTEEHRSFQMEYSTWHEAARQDLTAILDDVEALTDTEVEALWNEHDEVHHFAHAGVSCFDEGMLYFGQHSWDALIDYIFSDSAYADKLNSDDWEIVEFEGVEIETGYDDEAIAEIEEVVNRYSISEFVEEFGVETDNPRFLTWKQENI